MTIVLYSFRRCPYAMRARMVLDYSNITCDIREVDLKNKPSSLLKYSPKGTVPVMILGDGAIIDQSLDIMKYAISISDPEDIYSKSKVYKIDELIKANDEEFIKYLQRYKYPEKYPGTDALQMRVEAEKLFLNKYEDMLTDNNFLLGAKTLADYAILPLLRQFAYADEKWFFNSKYKNLIKWLRGFTENEHFENVIMQKNEIWIDS